MVVQIVYYLGQIGGPDSWMWARTNAFSSNIAIADPCSIQLGQIARGILAPTFGAHLPTQLEAWRPVNFRDWQLGGMGGIPRPRNFDQGPDTVDWLPPLGGAHLASNGSGGPSLPSGFDPPPWTCKRPTGPWLRRLMKSAKRGEN